MNIDLQEQVTSAANTVRMIQPELSLSTENRFDEIPIVYKKPEALLMLTTAQNVQTEATFQCEFCGKQLKTFQKYKKHFPKSISLWNLFAKFVWQYLRQKPI